MEEGVLHKLHDNEFKSNSVYQKGDIMWAQTDVG